MQDINNPGVVERARERIGQVTAAIDLPECHGMEMAVAGWFAALHVEGLIDKDQHDRLKAELDQAVSDWDAKRAERDISLNDLMSEHHGVVNLASHMTDDQILQLIKLARTWNRGNGFKIISSPAIVRPLDTRSVNCFRSATPDTQFLLKEDIVEFHQATDPKA